MQVKHPPNQIRAILDVTSTSSNTYLCMYDSTASKRPYEKVLVDGEEIAFKYSGGKLVHVFPTLGEHEVVYIMKKDKPYSGASFFGSCSNHISIDFSEFRTGFTDCNNLFSYCSKLQSIKGFKVTKDCTTINDICYNCSKLTDFEVGNWDVSNVLNMGSSFRGCSSMLSFNVGNWDTRKVTDMRSMYQSCTSLVSLDLSNWDVSSVTYLNDMFYGCSALQSLDLSKWTPQSVTSTKQMLYNCTALQSLDLNNLDLSGATDISSMMYGCTSLQSLNLDNMRLPISETANISGMFYGVKVNLDVTNLILGANPKGLFKEYKGTNIVGLESWDLSRFTDISELFAGCTNLTDLSGIANWDVVNITNMRALFRGVYVIEDIPIENWDVSNVEDMSYMFYTCWGLTSLKISNWDVRKVKTIGNFIGAQASQTEKISSVDISRWDLASCDSVASAFAYRKFNLILPDNFGYNTKFFGGLFSNSITLINSIDFNKLNTSKATDISSMLRELRGRTEFDLSSWDLSKVTSWDLFLAYSQFNVLKLNTELSDDAIIFPYTNNKSPFYSSDKTGSGNTNATLYYYPHPNFVAKFLPNIPAKWTVVSMYEPTECVSLSLEADEVRGQTTSAKVKWKAVTNGTDINGNHVEGFVTGGEFVAEFAENTGTEPIYREVSFTYLGVTASGTIKQLPIIGDIVARYNVTSTSSSTQLVSSSFNTTQLNKFDYFKIDGEIVSPTKSYQFASVGEHVVEMFLKEDISSFEAYDMFYRIKTLKEFNAEWFDMSLMTSSNSMREVFYECTELEKVTLSKTTTRIGDQFLYGCSKLSSLTILRGTAPSVTSNSFGSSSSSYAGKDTKSQGINKLYVPAGATGYEGGYWDSVLFDSTKCGFTKVEI